MDNNYILEAYCFKIEFQDFFNFTNEVMRSTLDTLFFE